MANASVVAGSVGIHAKFVRSLDENSVQTNTEETETSASGAATCRRRHPYKFSIDQANLNGALPRSCNQFNGFRRRRAQYGQNIFVGSKTDHQAALNWLDDAIREAPK